MKIWFALFVFSSLPSSAAVAQTADVSAQDVSAQLSAEQANASNLQNQLNQLGSEHQGIKQRHDSLQQKFQADADAYNASCAGRPVNTGNCQSWRDQVLAEKDQIGSEVERL